MCHDSAGKALEHSKTAVSVSVITSWGQTDGRKEGVSPKSWVWRVGPNHRRAGRHDGGTEGTDDDPFLKFIGAVEAMTSGAVKGRRGRKDRTSGEVEGGGRVTGSHSTLLLHFLGKPGGEHQLTCRISFPRDPNLPRESPSPGFAAVAWPRYRPDTREYLKIGECRRGVINSSYVSLCISQGMQVSLSTGRH